MSQKPKICIITNIPSPYRVLQFDKLQTIFPTDFFVIYCRHIEKDRKWKVPSIKHKHCFLNQGFLSRFSIYVRVITVLRKNDPGIVIVAGFNAISVLTFLYSLIKRKRFVVFTDCWLHSVNQMSIFHRWIRKIIIPRADAYICVGTKGKEFLLKYNAAEEKIFRSPLAIDNDYYASYYKPRQEKKFDVIFSGQFIERKMPFFMIEVATKLSRLKKDFCVLVIGSGPMEGKILSKLTSNNVSFHYPGFIQQNELPNYYADSKILLLPTKDDCWGLVANEACAVGTPVITCNNAGVADDLIQHNFNGYILPLDVEVWVKHIVMLLEDDLLYEAFSKNALKRVKYYSIDMAALGIKNAIDFCVNNE